MQTCCLILKLSVYLLCVVFYFFPPLKYGWWCAPLIRKWRHFTSLDTHILTFYLSLSLSIEFLPNNFIFIHTIIYDYSSNVIHVHVIHHVYCKILEEFYLNALKLIEDNLKIKITCFIMIGFHRKFVLESEEITTFQQEEELQSFNCMVGGKGRHYHY